MVLDLDDSHDAELARELAIRADVIVENFKTGATNPDTVYCSITGFGTRGGAHLAGYDFLVQAVGGLMSVTGYPETAPAKVGVALVDVLTAKDATIGVLAALAARARDGVGQHVEVNLLSSLLGSLANQASSFLTTGVAPGRLGNQHPSIAPYETLSCKDGLIALCCGNDASSECWLPSSAAPAWPTTRASSPTANGWLTGLNWSQHLRSGSAPTPPTHGSAGSPP